MTTAAEQLARWGLGLRLDDVPADVRHAAALHLLDGAGVALAAAARGEGAFAADVARGLGGPAEATILGSRDRVPAPMAALANGTFVHALDYDDTHTGSLCHPTSVALPVAFAVGEQRGASGAEVLAAAIAGYEVLVRLGAAVGHGFHARGFHATSVCGVFAAALAAARLMGMDERTTVHALGIAGSQASGSLEFLHTGASTKQLHPGWAAHAGIMAARLAAAGATGPDSIVEGPYGLFAAYAAATVDPCVLTDGLGSRWDFRTTSIKPYPACQLFHASLDALAAARPQVGGREIVSVVVDVPREAVPIVCEPRAAKLRPRSAYEGKFSLPFSAAALLIDGDVGVASYDDLERPDVLALASRVEHRTTDPGVAPGDAPGRVEVVVAGGEPVVATAPGGGREATAEAVGAKLASHGLGNADRLAAAVLGLAEAPDMTWLR